ncbi:MAG: hemolysin III family protein [Myxococcota bacterium]
MRDPGGTLADALQKPVFRGLLHQYAAPTALGAGLVLVAIAPTGRASVAVAVFAASLVLQFGVSALLHRGDWTLPAENWIRRVDHASIFVLIAGTYTPVALIGLPVGQGESLLQFVWGGAALGILYCVLNLQGPKWWRAGLALALGWSIAPYIGELRAAAGDPTLGLLVAGGAIYTLGALVYATERPTLWPATFGFHEAFHAATVAAAALHFASVFALVTA